MRKYPMPIYIVIFLIGATALWYFGHHRPAQRLLKAEPKKIYKSTTPLQPNRLSVEPGPSDTMQEPRDGNAEIRMEEADTKTEDTDSAAMPEKVDNSWNQDEDANSDKLVPQEGLATEDPAAAEAYEKYFTAESEYLAAQDMLQAALEARPIDWDRVRDETDNLKNAGRRRKEALQNLAPYSETAAKLLEKMKENEKRAEEMTAGHKAEIREYEAEIREMEEVLENLRSK